jgi:hypothetical protein
MQEEGEEFFPHIILVFHLMFNVIPIRHTRMRIATQRTVDKKRRKKENEWNADMAKLGKIQNKCRVVFNHIRGECESQLQNKNKKCFSSTLELFLHQTSYKIKENNASKNTFKNKCCSTICFK